jgi:hypothetical protein
LNPARIGGGVLTPPKQPAWIAQRVTRVHIIIAVAATRPSTAAATKRGGLGRQIITRRQNLATFSSHARCRSGASAGQQCPEQCPKTATGLRLRAAARHGAHQRAQNITKAALLMLLLLRLPAHHA